MRDSDQRDDRAVPSPSSPSLPEIDSPAPEEVLKELPSTEEIIEQASTAEEILEQQPSVDEMLHGQQ